MAFNKKFIIGSAVLLVFGAGSVLAQACPDGTCDPGEDSVTCPLDCARLCEECVVTTDCEAGLVCEDGKCRGCPCGAGEICFCNPLHACAFDELVDNLVDFIFFVAIAFVPVMFSIAAFYFITAAGDAKRMSTAKTIIIWTLVGLFIVLMARGIIAVIRALF